MDTKPPTTSSVATAIPRIGMMNASPVATISPASDSHADRRAVRRAVVEAEADVLGIKPKELVKDLKAGQKVSDLAKTKGMTKEQFAARLTTKLKPRLEALVDHKVITKVEADRVLDRIAKGYVPFWDGLHRRK